MSDSEWKVGPHSAEARERSVEEARERIREAERENAERRCRCWRPVKALRSYWGVHPCRMCQRPIYPTTRRSR